MKEFNRVAVGIWVLFSGLLLAASLSVSADSGATALVKRTSERMISALESQRSSINRNPSKIYGLVDQIVVPHFDFEKITKTAVGKHWDDATPAQREGAD